MFIIEGEYYDVEGVEELAKIPSREELLGRLFGSWKSPVSNIARVFNQIAEKIPEGGTAKDAVDASAAAAPSEEAAPAQTEETPAEAPAEAPAAE